jgi:hypothetical protein
MVNYLAYGAVGLALALAVLAFRLPSLEQKTARPRAPILRAIYVYLGFAFALALSGFAFEYFKPPSTPSEREAVLQNKLIEAERSVERLQFAANEASSVLTVLNQTRDRTLTRLEAALSKPDSDPSLREFLGDLRYLHGQLRRLELGRPFLDEKVRYELRADPTRSTEH